MSTSQPLDLLRAHPFFSEATFQPGDGDGLIVRSLGADTVLLRAGATLRSVLALATGTAVLHARTAGGRRGYLAGILDAPSMIGDTEILTNSPSGFAIHTLVPTTLVEIPGETFERWIRRDSALAYSLYRSASVRSARLKLTLERILTEPMPHQLMSLLWDLSHVGPENLPVARVSQSKLTRALGVDRKTIARNLVRLSKEGALRVTGREAVLLRDRRGARAGEKGGRKGGGTWRISEFSERRGDRTREPAGADRP